jgi:hypothetical protein
MKDEDFHKDFHGCGNPDARYVVGTRESSTLKMSFQETKNTDANARIDGLLHAMLQSKFLRSRTECRKEHTNPTTDAGQRLTGSGNE